MEYRCQSVGDSRLRTGLMATYGKRGDVPNDRIRDRGALIPRWVAKHKTAEVSVSS